MVWGREVGAGQFSPDFFEGAGKGVRVYIAEADGSGLRQLPSIGGMGIDFAVWSPDQKSIYLDGDDSAGTLSAWRWDVDGSNPEKFVDNCAVLMDADPSGRYLLGVVHLDKGQESTRCPSPTGNVSSCFPA